jgi:hypothetical protein
MHLFLDTNIYLNFYKLSDDDLEQLRKLSVAVRQSGTTLYLTDQVRAEFRRNREKTIADSLKLLEDVRLPKGFPRLFMNLPAYEELRQTLDSFEGLRSGLIKEVREAAAAKTLHADALIEELFGLAHELPMTEEIWEAAQKRYDLGNPPGKGDSYGDAINWQSLLVDVPDEQDLLLVTGDSDFMSPLDPTLLADVLLTEWVEKKRAGITVYKTLTALFKDHYPDIRLASELERELVISRLIGSESFMQTHAAIAGVSQYVDFTPEQAQALIEAANRNTQIRRILEDEDVRQFFTDVANDFGDVIDPATLSEFWEYFEPDDWDYA